MDTVISEENRMNFNNAVGIIRDYIDQFEGRQTSFYIRIFPRYHGQSSGGFPNGPFTGAGIFLKDYQWETLSYSNMELWGAKGVQFVPFGAYASDSEVMEATLEFNEGLAKKLNRPKIIVERESSQEKEFLSQRGYSFIGGLGFKELKD